MGDDDNAGFLAVVEVLVTDQDLAVTIVDIAFEVEPSVCGVTTIVETAADESVEVLIFGLNDELGGGFAVRLNVSGELRIRDCRLFRVL